MISRYKQKILRHEPITKGEVGELIDADLEELCAAAQEIQNAFCGNAFDLCAIVNGKCGSCSEDCKFCAQSSHNAAQLEGYPLLEEGALVQDALVHEKKGVLRYAVVTSGRSLSAEELHQMCESFWGIRQRSKLSLCASHGLLSYEQLCQLKMAGVSRYHANLESSRRFFPSICSTHSYDDKIATIRAAQQAGLSVCSGGIFGMGETIEDRISMALELRALGVRSVPINILNPIPGTPFAHLEKISEAELRRTIALFRLILPDAALRLAGGRGLLADKGESMFCSGANAAITGDMLTTSGITVEEDGKMLERLGYEVREI